MSGPGDTKGGFTGRSKHPEPLEVVRERRNAGLQRLVDGIPYAQFLGIHFDRRGDELTGILPYSETHIGNPILPALHGGVTASFLEVTAITALSWAYFWRDIEEGRMGDESAPLLLPKTIDFSIDYLRSGLPRDAYARARVTRMGRRYASVQTEAWQDNRDRPFAQARGHFLMPARDD